jgi:hypothetical protein
MRERRLVGQGEEGTRWHAHVKHEAAVVSGRGLDVALAGTREWATKTTGKTLSDAVII